MEEKAVPTCFAPALRDSPRRVQELHDSLRRNFIAQTLDAIPVILLILNRHRQIVLANAQALRATDMSMEELLGKRPGEAFGCVHAFISPGGCGTTEFCSKCGAVRAILLGLEGHKNIQECSILRHGQSGIEALDLQVSSSPIQVEGHDLLLFTIQDQSDLKRRHTLERLFFHDMLNTAGGLRGLMDMLRLDVPAELRPDAEFIFSALSHLVEELLAQKDLMAAENNELNPVFIALQGREILDVAAKIGANLAPAEGKTILVAQNSENPGFVSDYTLIKRVLGNMIKNALEASRPGETVTVSCRQVDGEIVFEVNNPAVMADDVRLRVFKRNFSTKGLGRGLGTYGMKLLTERFLHGSVSFTSRSPEGTTFTLCLPADPKSRVAASFGGRSGGQAPA